MENKACVFSYAPGSEKVNEGKFLQFSNIVITDDSGNCSQQTMAMILQPDGNIVQVEPQCIKITKD